MGGEDSSFHLGVFTLYAPIRTSSDGAPRALLDDIPACAITLNLKGDPDVDYC